LEIGTYNAERICQDGNGGYFIFNLGLQFLGMNFMVPSNKGSAVGLEK
jgi:hypothetical protein